MRFIGLLEINNRPIKMNRKLNFTPDENKNTWRVHMVPPNIGENRTWLQVCSAVMSETTQVIIVGFARFLSKWSLEILASKATLRLRISFPSPSLVTSPFSRTPTPWDAFLSLPKPFPSLNPRWHSLHQNALAHVFARQNTPALQATTFAKVSLRSVGLFLLRDAVTRWVNKGATW